MATFCTELAVTVHGRAVEIDIGAGEQAGYRRALLDIYLPRYGAEWEALLDERRFARIDAERMFTFHLAPEQP